MTDSQSLKIVDKLNQCLTLLNQWPLTDLEIEKLRLLGVDLLDEDRGCHFSRPLQEVICWRVRSHRCNAVSHNALQKILKDCPLIPCPLDPIRIKFLVGIGVPYE